MTHNAIKVLACELLDSGKANVVIGYGEGSHGKVRAVFVKRTDQADQLLYDERCKQNLAVYLPKEELRHLGKPAIIAHAATMRTLVHLFAECQIADDGVYTIGIMEDGTLKEFPTIKDVTYHISKIPFTISEEERKRVNEIERMLPEERWAFWRTEFEPCMKCYACRAACALCYCETCTVSCNSPQWIHVPAHELGNLEWHIMRAMHLAGRCTNCGDCARACPLGIHLNILTQKLAEDVARSFGATAGKDGEETYPLSVFDPNDKENFFR